MKTQTVQHTPTPWREAGIKPKDEGPLTALVGDINEESVHIGTIRSKEDAAFIVRAVNSHEELLGALKGARMLLVGLPVDCKPMQHAYDLIDEAISRAEGSR
jgi:hypothetical protein